MKNLVSLCLKKKKTLFIFKSLVTYLCNEDIEDSKTLFSIIELKKEDKVIYIRFLFKINKLYKSIIMPCKMYKKSLPIKIN